MKRSGRAPGGRAPGGRAPGGRAPSRELIYLSVALAGCITLLLGSCATLPSSGPVQRAEAPRQDDDARAPFVRVIAPGPQKGAKPEEIVRGFLLASSNREDDYATARTFLEPAAASRWRAEAGVVVLDTPYGVAASPSRRGVRDPRQPVESRVVLRGKSVGRIDSDGRYVGISPALATEVPFVLRSNGDGDWRISEPPDGLHLPRHEVDRVYRPFDLYFLTEARTSVVPDPVLLPIGPDMASQLTARLLAGPTDDLRDAVRTAFPDGTKLGLPAVPVAGGVADVDLSSEALRAEPDDRRRMSAQLAWTLQQLRDVQYVRVSVDRAPLSVPDAAEQQPVTAWGAFDPDVLASGTRPYALVERRIGRLDGSEFTPLPGAAGAGHIGVRAPAISLDYQRVAALSSNGKRLYTGRIGEREPLVPRLPGQDFADPSYDVTGTLWVLDRGAQVVWAMRPDSAPVLVRLPRLDGRMKHLRVSRDGTRVGVVLTDAKQRDGLRVGTVERAGEAPRVASLRAVAPALSLVQDLSWADAGHLAVLAQVPGGVPQPYLVSIDGLTVEALSAVPAGSVSLTAGPGTLPLLLGTKSGQVYELSGRSLVNRRKGFDPVYPG